jgi:excinuclease ABC subunit A
LRDIGNTIVVVEHDEDTIFASDYIVDIGPGAGVHGGNVIVQGYLKPLLEGKNKEQSLTIDYLQGVARLKFQKNVVIKIKVGSKLLEHIFTILKI